jgi:outer membrane protein
MPIYSGGMTSSKIQEAVYLHRASREKLQRIARETERETRDAFLGVTSEISRVNAFKQAVKSSETALEATQAGFEVGTRTIVDVLNSQFALESAIQNYSKSRYDYIANVFYLKQAAGTLRVQDLEEIDQWFKERDAPEDIIK